MSEIKNGNNQKFTGEVTVTPDSLLMPQNILNNVWTISQQNTLALYTDTGIKLFSTQKKDEKSINFQQKQEKE